jgi:hypothetical protein
VFECVGNLFRINLFAIDVEREDSKVLLALRRIVYGFLRPLVERIVNWLRVFRWGLICLRASLGLVVTLCTLGSVKVQICEHDE